MTEARESRLTAWLLIGVPGLIWGASFLFMAEGLEATPARPHHPQAVALERRGITDQP